MRYKGNNATPAAFLESINGQPVTSMVSAYSCASIKTIPEIPNSIVEMTGAFESCNALVNISSCVIPSNVTSLDFMFMGCRNLEVGPKVHDFGSSMFMDCGNLATIYFTGTADECEAMMNGDWNEGCGEISVICDGGETVTVPAYEY